MKNMNYKIEKLLHEGFSMKTLDTFTSNQIDVLYHRVINEQKGSVKMKSATPEQVKAYTDQGVNVEIGEGDITEKSKSKKQQKAMGIALAAKRGDIPKSKLKGSSKEMVKMSEKDLEDFASTKHKGLPEKKKKESKETVKNLEESIMKLIENHLNPTTTKGDLLKTIKSFKR